MAVLDKEAFEVQELSAEKMSCQHQLATMRARLEVELLSVSTKCGELEEKAKKLAKDTLEKDKSTQAYAEYRRSIAEEAELATKQEAFTRLTNRANELLFQITESKIRLEADLSQKEEAGREYQLLLKSQENLEEQKSEIENEAKDLDKLETEFQLIEENSIRIKSSIEVKQHKIESLRLQQREKAAKIRSAYLHSTPAYALFAQHRLSTGQRLSTGISLQSAKWTMRQRQKHPQSRPWNWSAPSCVNDI